MIWLVTEIWLRNIVSRDGEISAMNCPAVHLVVIS